IETIRRLRESAEETESAGATVYNAKWNEAINMINLTLVADMIARSALVREESRGAHYRSDYPAPDPAWLGNIFIAPAQGQMSFSVRPVEFARLKPPELQVSNKYH